MGIQTSRRCGNCQGPIHARNKSGFCSKNPRCMELAAQVLGRRRGHVHNAEYAAKYRAEHPSYGMYASAQARAKARGIAFTITRKDIDDALTGVCPALLIPLKRNERGNANPDSPTLDRIDSTRGYEQGNIQVLSNKANRMKSDATPEELLLFADWIYMTYGKGYAA